MSDYTLYAAPVSLFSGKARAYLRWKGIPFTEVLSTPEVMKEILMPVIGWPVIPVLKTPDGILIQDTADIINHIENRHAGPSVMPEGSVQKFATELLHTFADQWLTLPAMHYRWNYNEEWTYSAFGKTALPAATAADQYKVGKKRGQMFKAMAPMLGVTDGTIPGIEKSYLGFLTDFSAHLEKYPYLFGGRPSLADFAFYGPLYAHLYRDPESGKIMKAHAPLVADWVERMRDGEESYGPLIGCDSVPETLWPLLARHFKEHLPVLEQTNTVLAGHIKTLQDTSFSEPLPRALGMAAFEVEGRKGQTVARPFSLFRLQAALDIYNLLEGDSLLAAERLLEKTDGVSLKEFTLPHRLVRKNYKLALAETK
jgi:glutathione S-transferase